MKKTMLILIVAVFLFVMTSCGSNSQENAKPRVAIALGAINNAWHAQLREVIDAAVANHPDIEWTVKNAQDVQDQINMLTLFKNEGYDAIIIMPMDGNIIVPIAEEIFEAGIPTIILNRRIASENYTAMITGDNYGGGVNAARLFGRMLEGEGNLVILRSFIGTPIDTERNDGFAGTLTREFPNINIIAQGDCEFNRDVGYNVMSNILNSFPHIDALFAHDDEAAMGALNAIHEAGRTDIKYIVGFGGLEEVYEMFQTGESTMYLASMSYFPGMGFDAVEMAVRILRVVPSPKDTIIASQVVDAWNVEDFLEYAY